MLVVFTRDKTFKHFSRSTFVFMEIVRIRNFKVTTRTRRFKCFEVNAMKNKIGSFSIRSRLENIYDLCSVRDMITSVIKPNF